MVVCFSWSVLGCQWVFSKGPVFESVVVAVMYSQAMSVQFVTH